MITITVKDKATEKHFETRILEQACAHSTFVNHWTKVKRIKWLDKNNMSKILVDYDKKGKDEKAVMKIMDFEIYKLLLARLYSRVCNPKKYIEMEFKVTQIQWEIDARGTWVTKQKINF